MDRQHLSGVWKPGAATIIALLLAAGCSASSSPGGSDGSSVAALQSVDLEERSADSIRSIDVINRSKSHVKRTGEIYLMRGLANVFSRGIDDMAVQLRRRGYDASNFSYTEWQGVASDIANRARRKKVSYPVVIIGHSLGGNESSKFANYLADSGVPVALVVAFDPVETGRVGKGIKKVVNYYLPKSADNRILAESDFDGILQNIDVTVDPEMTHTNVDKSPKFQTATLNEIAGMTSKLRRNDAPRTPEGR